MYLINCTALSLLTLHYITWYVSLLTSHTIIRYYSPIYSWNRISKETNWFLQEVKDSNQAKWYKRMYDTLHRSRNDGELMKLRIQWLIVCLDLFLIMLYFVCFPDEYVTVRYKTHRGDYLNIVNVWFRFQALHSLYIIVVSRNRFC